MHIRLNFKSGGGFTTHYYVIYNSPFRFIIGRHDCGSLETLSGFTVNGWYFGNRGPYLFQDEAIKP